MNKGVVLLSLIILCLIPLVSSQDLGVFKTNSCINLIQTCTNCTFVNISSLELKSPNSYQLLNQTVMQKSGIRYNVTFCNTTVNGDYLYWTFGDPNSALSDPVGVNFIVNPLGRILTNSQAILYTVIFIIAFILFVITFAIGISAPGGNTKDAMTGYVLAVSNLKYLKMFMICVSYLLLMLILYFGWIISYGYLDLDFIGTLFNWGFYVMVVLLLPLFIVGTYVIIANWVRDSKVAEALQQGLRIR